MNTGMSGPAARTSFLCHIAHCTLVIKTDRTPYHTKMALAIGLTAVALAIRMWDLTGTDIAGDEAFSVLVAHQQPRDIVRFLNTGNNPPLFELLLHFWMRIIGDTDRALRLLPAILSALTVIPVFAVATRKAGRRAGVVAASLLALSWQHVRFSHEVRAYALFGLLSGTALYLLTRCLDKPLDLRNWLLLSMCNVALLYTHYLAVFAVGAQAIAGMALMDRLGRIRLLAMLVAVGTLFAPGLYVFLNRGIEVSAQGTWVPPTDVRQLYGAINLMLNSRVATVLLLMTVAIGTAMSWGRWASDAVRTEAWGNRAVTMVLLWWTLTYLGLFATSVAVLPVFIDRYLLFTSVALYVGVAWAVEMAWRRTPFSWTGPLLAVAAALLTSDLAPSNHRNVALATAAVHEQLTEGTCVVVAPASESMAFAFHFDRDLFAKVRGADPVAVLRDSLATRKIFVVNTASDLPALTSERLIFYNGDVAFTHPDNGIDDLLAERYTETLSLQFERIFQVRVYEVTP
jgi:mannosyltransferase